WTFDAERDRTAHGLTHAQCDIAFPLRAEINRSAIYWKDGIVSAAINITQRNVPALRVLIYDQQLYIIQAKGAFEPWRDRMIGTLGQLHRAIITAPEPVPNIEFSMSVKDDAPTPASMQNAIFNFNRKFTEPGQDALWLMPAFNYWAWKGVVGSYTPFQKMLKETDKQDMADKKPVAVWRGAVGVNPPLREPLLKAAEGKEWANVAGVDWGNKTDLQAKWIDMADHCDYAFPIYTEGTTWSGRLKYLLNCRSALVMPESEWITPLHALLQSEGPDQNFISVRRDWQDLEERITYYQAHWDEAQKIADNAVATFRDHYITPAAEACYWRQLFKTYATVAFKPYLYEDEEERGVYDARRQKVRGMTYEEW
ncbi:lipopolysaccharide-modifying protein, partial [Elsinoe ampelina]